VQRSVKRFWQERWSLFDNPQFKEPDQFRSGSFFLEGLSHYVRRSLILFCLGFVLSGCKDFGEPVTNTPGPPPGSSLKTYQNDILPLILQYGCFSCHGGNGGLYITSIPEILRGGDHGPAIIPGNANASLIIQKVSPTPPFGDRMPQGGPYLPDSTTQIFKDWINQGAN